MCCNLLEYFIKQGDSSLCNLWTLIDKELSDDAQHFTKLRQKVGKTSDKNLERAGDRRDQ